VVPCGQAVEGLLNEPAHSQKQLVAAKEALFGVGDLPSG
jgi:hypothetical protein